jgi:dTDP-4-amino-4,6-dideoxygalactose transaminase
MALRGARGVSFMRSNLGVGDCPWAFPIRVQKRDELLKTLLAEGIGAWAWPVLPNNLPQQSFSNEVRLARESLLLPVHQDLRRRHIEFMADTVTAWGIANG